MTDIPERLDQRFVVVVSAALAALAGFWVATLAGVPAGALDLAYTVLLALVPPLAWWAAMRAPLYLRPFVTIAAGAVTAQAVGSVLWYVAFLANNSRIPQPPGFWTPFLYLAMVLAGVAAWVGVRDVLRIREAILDYSIILAAGACATVVVLHDQFDAGWSLAAVDGALRVLFSVFLVVLVASAALGRWQGLPLPVGLVGVSLLFTAAGTVWFYYLVAQDAYRDDRWPDALWLTGLVMVSVACAATILGIDRPIRLAREALPGVSPWALLMVATMAWGVAVAVGVMGVVGDEFATLCAGAVAVAWIGLAALLRALGVLREARGAYRRLDQAHASLELAHEHADALVRERDATIAQLAQRNVELTAIQTLLGSVLDFADERSNGELRSRLEETAAELTGWLPSTDPEA